ncbi:interleukin-12 subunit beta-like [Ahaetulla prasina]|uniref:interleukin-12 subunit beta-like n=1 Tax=Ahaetulla prasina TaxID=499056 RepID=UPI0026472F59|nr:interleukin-12 subunit beta-like [Ahaetulla prasina]XP_058024970.1 interleukin-12 subunit beta-like [Ahaetulla prasina]XP_058024971.1 interleukin-12 subunit beta-like [Ahaetulla prasina]XP_058024972.1 interleukin-12 subunit beta-like [Ahaetulla prasina]XP_058024973.1 interleukin-12 subunit beta-like [Ahaetulla prasina]XP_058024974.1 interleukin-12 subunit beta-like [Ahaetulla prasina]XP_058024975.1 interleukin-12 subunit beta-like [Ahaetulla prasina]
MTFIIRILMFTLTVVAYTEATQEIRTNEYFVESQWSSDNSARPKNLMLICDTSESQHGSVYWKKGLKRVGNGRTLTIRIRGTPDAGNYTCWSDTTHELLSSNAVYITKKNEKGEIDEPILKKDPEKKAYFYCEANNYSGNFTCFWKVQSQNPSLKFRIEYEDGNQMKSGSGTLICDINSEKTNTEYSASCRRENPCSYTEEYEPIVVFLHVFLTDVFVYEKHTRRFFIKDILKPDISPCQVTTNGTLILLHPATWSTPVSYFGLTYQIKMVFNNNEQFSEESLFDHGDIMTITKKLRCYSGYHCLIRSRDYYNTHSAWSNWSNCR